MPIVNMNCPRCKKEATEYATNKWKCLHCGGKFLYDANAPEKAPKSRLLSKDDAAMVIMLISVLTLFLLCGVMGGYYTNKESQRKHEFELAKIEAGIIETNSVASINIP